jgi:hypothetical protein
MRTTNVRASHAFASQHLALIGHQQVDQSLSGHLVPIAAAGRALAPWIVHDKASPAVVAKPSQRIARVAVSIAREAVDAGEPTVHGHHVGAHARKPHFAIDLVSEGLRKRFHASGHVRGELVRNDQLVAESFADGRSADGQQKRFSDFGMRRGSRPP